MISLKDLKKYYIKKYIEIPKSKVIILPDTIVNYVIAEKSGVFGITAEKYNAYGVSEPTKIGFRYNFNDALMVVYNHYQTNYEQNKTGAI